MGMYDNVEFKAACTKCRSPLSDFQTKARDDEDRMLGMFTLEELLTYMEERSKSAFFFYTSCDNCHTWHEWRYSRGLGALLLPNKEDTVQI